MAGNVSDFSVRLCELNFRLYKLSKFGLLVVGHEKYVHFRNLKVDSIFYNGYCTYAWEKTDTP